jgi:hypothetical protein
MITRTTAQGEVWIYAEGARVTFRDGKVTQVLGAEQAADRSANAMTVVPEAPRSTRSSVQSTNDDSIFGTQPMW